jgi:hypothetical protein
MRGVASDMMARFLSLRFVWFGGFLIYVGLMEWRAFGEDARTCKVKVRGWAAKARDVIIGDGGSGMGSFEWKY